MPSTTMRGSCAIVDIVIALNAMHDTMEGRRVILIA